MKVRTLLIVITMVVIGAGGKFAYDAYQDHERQKMWEMLSSPASCNTCAARKANLKRRREDSAQRALSEELDDSDVE